MSTPKGAGQHPFFNSVVTLINSVVTCSPTSVFGTRLIRAALLYISSDLPATRKLCGFLWHKRQSMAAPNA